MEIKHITIFSGSSIIVKGLQNRLDDMNIRSLTKDRFESARLAGFGSDRNAIELLILKSCSILHTEITTYSCPTIFFKKVF